MYVVIMPRIGKVVSKKMTLDREYLIGTQSDKLS